jgi:hypothetical protein
MNKTKKIIVPENIKEGIIDFFLTEKDNRMIVIAKEFGYSTYIINKVVDNHLFLK